VFEATVASGQPRYVAIAYRMRALVTESPPDYEKALAQHAMWGNAFEEARTRLLYGETLRRNKRKQEARHQLAAAAAGFELLGAVLWERRARDELRAAGFKSSRTPTGVGLTAQEQRIALLVADGLTNKEIAARLVVSTKTVEGHLRNIFEKLGATSRTQVARMMPP
jgi:DNA-binding CsgD family transcriptional regulator